MTALRPAFLALLFLGALPAPLRAQTDIVNNLAALYSGGDPLDAPGLASAQPFTTGPAAFRLDSVSLKLNLIFSSSLRVKLWSGSGSSPVAVVEDLGTFNFSSSIGGTQTVTSTARPLLEPNTRYWISVANVSGGFDWTLTASPANLSGAGATVTPSRESSNSGTTWPDTGATGEYHRFAVHGIPYLPGGLDTTFTPPADLNNEVEAIALQPDGRILVGGFFSEVGGVATLDRLVRLEADGSRDTSFTPPANLNSDVRAIALQPDGRILIGGAFTDVDGVATLDSLARLEAEGSRDTSFTPPTGLNDQVLSLALQPDGRILIGGVFTEVGGVTTLDKLVRLEADGSRDTSFTPPANLNRDVWSIALQPDGRILVGGNFTDVGGVSALDRLVRLEADGSLDPSFLPPVIADGTVRSVALQPEGRILIGGSFINVGGVSALDGLVRLETNGSLNSSFTPPANSNGVVYSIALQTDGRILAGGVFFDLGGVGTVDRLLRLEAGGAIDSAFTPVAFNQQLQSLALQADGRILAGGQFFNVGGIPTLDHLARLENAPASGALIVPQRSTVTWTRGGAAPEASRVTFEVSTDGGTTYQAPIEAGRIAGGWQRTGLALPLAGTIRARAFVHGGYQNGSSGLVEEILAYTLTRSPVLTLTGKTKLTTSKSRLTLRGTASDPDGDLTAVQFKDSGGKWRSAKGTTTWTAKAKLKPGRNTILIAAYDSRNVASAFQRVKVKRE